MIVDNRVIKLIELARLNPNTHEANTALLKAQKILGKGQSLESRPNSLLASGIKDYRTWKERLSDACPWNQKINVMPFRSFIRVEQDVTVTLQIIPDKTVHSGRAVESILNTFHSMREGIMDRIWNEGFCICMKSKDFASFRIVYEN